jgi:microcompartment protein CcmL/EutN
MSTSIRIVEQMAVLAESLRELRGDVRAMRLAIEAGAAAHARHVARGNREGKNAKDKVSR